MYGAFGMARVEDANGDNGRLIDGHWSRPSSVEIRIYPDAWPPTSCQALLTSNGGEAARHSRRCHTCQWMRRTHRFHCSTAGTLADSLHPGHRRAHGEVSPWARRTSREARVVDVRTTLEIRFAVRLPLSSEQRMHVATDIQEQMFDITVGGQIGRASCRERV